MSENENVQIVQRALRLLTKGDIPAFLATLAEDVEWLTPGPPEIIPFAGSRQGREQVAQWVTALSSAEEIEKFDPKDFMARGDNVVVLGNSRVRVKSTGRILESEWVHVYTLCRGKIVAFRELYDTAAEVETFRADIGT